MHQTARARAGTTPRSLSSAARPASAFRPRPFPVQAKPAAGSATPDLLDVYLQQRQMAIDRPTGFQPPDPLIQRKNLEQAGLASTLGAEKTGRKLVSDGRTANVYYNQTSSIKDPERTKVQALQHAAELSAVLGKSVDDYAKAPPIKAKKSNDKWNYGLQGTFNQKTEDKIDPFFFEAIVWYDPVKGEKRELLGFMYQHAPNWTGYIETIFDSTDDDTRDLPSMYVRDYGAYGPKPEKTGVDYASATIDTERNPQFSNIHDYTGSSKLIDLTGAKNKKAKHLDAYTKIAGEGARWKCVRKHASLLQDSSFFFTRYQNSAKGVTFKTLWKNWSVPFGKRYNIEDSVVENAIDDDLFVKGSTMFLSYSKLGAFDYDLDKHKSFEQPFNCLSTNPNAKGLYIQNPNRRFKYQVLLVTPSELLDAWVTAFNGDYGITDSAIAKAIKASSFGSASRLAMAKTKLRSTDYDLEAGKMYGT